MIQRKKNSWTKKKTTVLNKITCILADEYNCNVLYSGEFLKCIFNLFIFDFCSIIHNLVSTLDIIINMLFGQAVSNLFFISIYL